MSDQPSRAEEPAYELTAEGGSTLRVYTHIAATLDDLLTIEINGPADSVRLSWGDAVELSDVLRDAIGMGTFKEDALRAAEKRGAVKALTFAAEITKRSAAELAAATETPLVEGIVIGLAASISEYAGQIESGEAKL